MARQQQQDLRALGQAVRELRVQSRRSLRNLASTCEVSPRSLAELEAGRLDPGLELIAAIARGIGVRPSEIYVRADELRASAGP